MEVALTAPGAAHALITSLDRILTDSVAELLTKWGDSKPPKFWSDPTKPTGYARVTEAVRVLSRALDKLGKRDRAGIKKELTAQRDMLLASLAAATELAGDTVATAKPQPEGPRYLAIAARIEAAYSGCLSAQHAMQMAGPADVRKARDGVDVAEAELREANREMQALRSTSAFPSTPKLDAFATAESQTRELQDLAAITSQPARALRRALEQGSTASPEVAKLWVCFEPHTDRLELCAWRQRIYDEGRG